MAKLNVHPGDILPSIFSGLWWCAVGRNDHFTKRQLVDYGDFGTGSASFSPSHRTAGI